MNETLEGGLKDRGPKAAAAMNEYRESFESTLEVQRPTTYAVLIEAIAINPQRANHLDSLIRLALGMDTAVMVLDEATKIEATGLFDRGKMHEGPLDQSPAYPKFDFKRNGDEAYNWWSVLGHLVVTWFGHNTKPEEDQKQAKHEWAAATSPHKGCFDQGPVEPIEGLVAREAVLYQSRVASAYGRKVCTDRQRVDNLLEAAHPSVRHGLKYRLSLERKQLCRLNWSEFLTELEHPGNYQDCSPLEPATKSKPVAPKPPHTHAQPT